MANVMIDGGLIAHELVQLVYAQLRSAIPDLRIIDIGIPTHPRRLIPESVVDAVFSPQQASATADLTPIESRDLLRNIDAFSARFLEDPATRIARQMIKDHSAGRVLLSIAADLPKAADSAHLCTGHNLTIRVVRVYDIYADLFTWRFDAFYAFVVWPAETATLAVSGEVAA